MIALVDGLRSVSTAAVECLWTIGVERNSLLTGDDRETAELVGARCGIREIGAELLPHDNVTAIAADVGASLVVTLNGLALLRRRSVLDAVPPTQTDEQVPRSEPRAP